MEFTGKVIGYLPTRQGNSKGQVLTIYTLLFEEGDKFKNTICGSVFHAEGKEAPYLPKTGEEVKVSFNLVSREFNGKWYTDVKIWRMVATAGANTSSVVSNTPYQPQPQAQPPKQQTYQQQSRPSVEEEPYDSANANDVDLPF